jgi:two-component system, cell cycle response regulator
VSHSVQTPRHVLVAEDSPVCRKLLEDLLAGQRYELQVAQNGNQALAAFKTFQPDILLLDWVMPDISGPEVCRIIRKTQSKYVYIILITSNTDRVRVVEGLDAGADDFIGKPFDPDELLARIRVGSRVVEMSRDIEARNAQLQEAAHTDFLTGLPNRKAVEEFGVHQVHAAIRQRFPVWVIVADLDKFKLVNDAYGHAAGDEAIKKFASILKGNTRSADICGRLGGDEFALVVSYGERKAILQMVERLRADLANEDFSFEGKKIQITASFGIAGVQYPDTLSFHEVLIRADNALYAAKANGRNQVHMAVREFARQLA